MFSLVSANLSLLLARGKRNEVEGAMHSLFMLTGGGEIYKFEVPTARTIPALNNNLKFFPSATNSFQNPPKYLSLSSNLKFL